MEWLHVMAVEPTANRPIEQAMISFNLHNALIVQDILWME